MHWDTATIRIPGKPFLAIGEVATLIGYDRKTINRWVKDGTFPSPISIDKGRRWTAMSVGVWMAWKEYGPKGVTEAELEEKPRAKVAELEEGVKRK